MDWLSVTAGNIYSCGIDGNQTSWCWGHNSYGKLGDGTKKNSAFPVQVLGLNGAKQIATGKYHTCASTSPNGVVYCWGRNDSGQLGNGTTDESHSPVEVVALSAVLEVATGAVHSCAAKSDGSVWCWGFNGQGQLGVGTTGPGSLIPVKVIGISSALQVSIGDYHSCAVLEDGTVWCWGWDLHGALGDGTTDDPSYKPTPVQVIGLSEMISVAASPYHSACALRVNGTVWCWGANAGILGDGNNENLSTPIIVQGLVEVIDVAAGSSHTCAVKGDGSAWCWGTDSFGKLGNGDASDSNVPTEVVGLPGVIAITARDEHTCAIGQEHTGWCWGRNDFGELGNGNEVYGGVFEPIPVQMLETW